MHAVDLLDEALKVAECFGVEVRRQWLGEVAGGVCRIGNRWVLFANLSLSTEEQLEQVVEALRKSGVLSGDELWLGRCGPGNRSISSRLRHLLHAEICP